uniref:Uncharacterized protein MANES_05G044900 n=1 Tax=Rhizophora mucronata TaxID=61149 RepID=A0A2P2MQB1_RHIMU
MDLMAHRPGHCHQCLFLLQPHPVESSLLGRPTSCGQVAQRRRRRSTRKWGWKI